MQDFFFIYYYCRLTSTHANKIPGVKENNQKTDQCSLSKNSKDMFLLLNEYLLLNYF